MNRRIFLTQTAMAAGAMILPGCDALPTGKPTHEGPAIGLQLYTVRDEVAKGLEPLIEKIGKLGYTHLETYGYNEGNFFGKSPKEFRNLLYDNGLITPSGHYYNNDYITGTMDGWKKACEAANVLEQEYIVLPWIDEALRSNDADSHRKLAERITGLAKEAKAQGLKFAYHNHDFEFKYDWKGKTSLYQVLLEETDPELVKMEMDIYWVVFADGDPVTLFFQHPKRFPLWHVKDLDPFNKVSTDIGKGSIDFVSIFKNKSESGLAYFFVEQEHYPVSPLDSIEKNVGYVKTKLLA